MKRNIAITMAVIALITVSLMSFTAIKNDRSREGGGTSSASSQPGFAEKQEEAYERLEGVVDYIPASTVMTSHVDSGVSGDMQYWWNYYRYLLPTEFVVVEDLPKDVDVRAITYASFVPEVENAKYLYPFSYMLVVTVPVEQYDKAREYFVGDNTEYTFHHYVDTMNKQPQDDAYLIITENLAINEMTAIINGTGGATLGDTAYDNKFVLNQDAPSIYLEVQNYLDRLVSYKESYADLSYEAAQLITGMSKDAAWLGTTSDKGKTWNGEFVRGGLSGDKMDPLLGAQKIADTLELEMDENANVIDYDYGMSELMNGGISIATKSGKSTGYIMNYMDVKEQSVAKAPEGVDYQIILGPQFIKNIYQGAYTARPLKSVTLDITGNEMTLSFQYHTAEHAGLEKPIPALD